MSLINKKHTISLPKQNTLFVSNFYKTSKEKQVKRQVYTKFIQDFIILDVTILILSEKMEKIIIK